jgi:M6 family metalloprotease-like protein
MIFIDFPDHPSTNGSNASMLYDLITREADAWFANTTYGRLKVNYAADKTRFYRMPNKLDTYTHSNAQDPVQLFYQDAIEAWTAATGKELPDMDVLYIATSDNLDNFWGTFTYTAPVLTRGNSTVASQPVARRLVIITGNSYNNQSGNKALEHETAHTMGLPDLYNVNDQSDVGMFIGSWDIMATHISWAPDHFAWHKWKLGWLDDDRVGCVTDAGISTQFSLSPLEIEANGPGQVKAVVVKANDTFALVAEVRTYLGSDHNPTHKTGVLLYTVSTKVDSGMGPIRVLDANPGTGGNSFEEFSDAPLNLHNNTSLTVAGWGVKVMLTAQVGNAYHITVVTP